MSAAYQVRSPEDERRIADLEEENAYLRRQLALEIDADGVVRLERQFGLTPSQAIVLGAIVSGQGRTISKAAIVLHLDARGREHASDQVIDVHVCKLRQIVGFDAIGTVWGRGYRASAELLASLKAPLHPHPSSERSEAPGGGQ